MTDQQLIEKFQSIDDRLNNAFESNNIESISALLSDKWTLIESAFGNTTKESFITAIATGDLSHSSMMKKVFGVRFLEGTAIVTTRGMNIGSYKGESFRSEQWVTNIFSKENDDWICIMTQETPVTCE